MLGKKLHSKQTTVLYPVRLNSTRLKRIMYVFDDPLFLVKKIIL